MLNWIIWNKTEYLYKNGFGVKLPTNIDMLQSQTTNQLWLPLLPVPLLPGVIVPVRAYLWFK